MSNKITEDKALAIPPVEVVGTDVPPRSLGAELRVLARELRRAPDRYRVLSLAAAIVVILGLHMWGLIRLNEWHGTFFRAVEHKDLRAIGAELLTFLLITSFLLCVIVSQSWAHLYLKIRMREWLTHRLMDHWLTPGRAYRLTISSEDTVDPDQRIQDDVRNFSEMTTDLGVGAIQSLFLIVSFVGVLWRMSEGTGFHWGQTEIIIPGYMVWAALIYAAAGSLITARVGWPLIGLNVERYGREAHFRYSIVRLNECSESVAFSAGEADERRSLNRNFASLMDLIGRHSRAVARLTWITSGYSWLMIVLPVLVALPAYLQGRLDLGGLMMIVGAFGHVQASLKWFVENFIRIADWRSAVRRVVAFRDTVLGVDEYEDQTEQIELLPHPDGRLSFEKIQVNLINGSVVIADATAQIDPGERVLITGESGSGKSTLFRAIGGLWPWGSGIVRSPPRDEVLFLPQRPYIPLGTLANALAYPKETSDVSIPDLQAALRRVNLEEFIPLLHVQRRWDRVMSLGQQQRLAFARVLIHRPKWVFLDEATSALDDENERCVMSVFTDDLPQTTVLSIGHRESLAAYHTRTLHLISTESGVVLRRRPRKVRMPGFWERTKRIVFKSSKSDSTAKGPDGTGRIIPIANPRSSSSTGR